MIFPSEEFLLFQQFHTLFPPTLLYIIEEVTANPFQSSVNMWTMQFIICTLNKKGERYKFSTCYASAQLPLPGLHTFLLLDLF